MKSVVIRADANKSIGFGHFIRSLALAGYLKEYFECSFCTFNSIELKPSRYQLDEISKVAKYVSIEARSIEEYDTKFLHSLTGEEIVVLDNYFYSTEFQQKIKDKGSKLVYIDGLNDKHYVADVFISPGEMIRTSFSLEPYTFFLNGLSHSFLRQPFLLTHERSKVVPNTKSIVLAIGGADPYCLTNKLIRLIHEVDPNIQIETIAGDTVEISQDLVLETNVHRKLSAEEIINIFSNVEIGFFSASTICIEAMACQLPIAAGWYVDNQKDFYKYGVREGLFMPLGNLLDNESEIKSKIQKILNTKYFSMGKHIDFKKGKDEIINLFKKL